MPAAPEHFARAALRLKGMRSEWIETSSGRVHLMVGEGKGEGPSLLLLHGLGSAGVHFRPLVPHLLPWVKELILPDIPAHGFSDAPKDNLEITALRAALLEALAARIQAPTVVFGNSMGGLGAIALALEHPALVRALILCSPGGAAMSPSDLEDLLTIFQPKTHADALEFVDRLLTKKSWLRQAFAFGARRRFQDESLRDLISTIRAEKLLKPEDVAAIAAPTLLIWGKEDRILPPANLAFFRAHAPSHVRIVEPEGFGHSPHLEYPADLAALIRGFVETL